MRIWSKVYIQDLKAPGTSRFELEDTLVMKRLFALSPHSSGPVLFGIVLLGLLLSAASATARPAKVLVLNSYHKGYAWTDEQSQALEDVLTGSLSDILLDVFYLDWKRHPNQENLDHSARMLANRYRSDLPQVVAVTDNAALVFALEQRAALFPGVPIVFGGVLQEDADAIIGDAVDVTGVYQRMDPFGTMRLARQLGGKEKRFVFIRDDTESSRSFEEELREAATLMTPPAVVETISGVSFGRVLDRLQDADPGAVVLLGSYATDSEGVQLPLETFVKRITEASAEPVYGFYRNQLGLGIVGGGLLSGTVSGQAQARIVLDVLRGMSAGSIPPAGRESTKVIVDFPQLLRLGLSPASVPAGVEIHNRPFSVFETYREAIIGAAGVILLLGGATVALAFNVRRRKATQQSLEQHIDALQQSRTELARSEQRYSLAALAAREVIWEWDLRSGERSFSDRLEDILGIEAGSVASYATWLERIHPKDLARVRKTVDDYLEGRSTECHVEYRIMRADGEYIWLDSRASALRDETGAPCLLVGTYSDITEGKRQEESIRYLAYHDALTGLANRETLRADVARRILEEPGRKLTLVFIDLDNFKFVNDSFGHKTGDQLLVQAADRLVTMAGPDKLVARLGGDEFVVLCPWLDGQWDSPLANRLPDAFVPPFEVGGQTFYVGCSAGTATYPDDGTSFDTLLQNADTAMYHAKAAGKGGLARYDEGMREAAVSRVRIHNRLQEARADNSFSVNFQPQVCARTGRLRGVEALLRWRDRELGSVPPDQFIPACEESGLIIPVGEWVLKEACRTLRSFDERGITDANIGINVSVVQLMQADFVPRFTEIVEREKVDPRRLELEITETVVMGTYEVGRKRLKALREVGFQTGLDDFGVGYSSLTYLRNLPFTTLKLDKSFIGNLPRDPADIAMVRAIVDIAETLGLETVAEGVETGDQQAALAAAGCTWLQGYMIGKPMAEDDLFRFIESWQGFEIGAAAHQPAYVPRMTSDFVLPDPEAPVMGFH